MFLFYFITALCLIPFSLAGIRKWRTESVKSKLTRLLLLSLAFFLLTVGGLDLYDLLQTI